MTDHGLFSSSNFVLNVLLARWLTPQDYGAFAVTYTVFALAGLLQSALLTEPMLIFGSDKYRERVPEYLGTLMFGNLGYGMIVGLCLLLGALVIGFWESGALVVAFLGLSAAAPFMLFQLLMRHICYLLFKPHLAASAGALYMLLVLLGAYLLRDTWDTWLSAPAAFGLMALSSLAAGLLLTVLLRVNLSSAADSAKFWEIFKEHLSYGRWSVGTRVMSWVTASGFLVLLPVFAGLEASGALRALMNLIMPVMQAYGALSVLLLPTLVRAREGGNFWRIVRLTLLLFVCGAGTYWLILGVLHGPVVSWIYNGRYDQYAKLLWLLGLVTVAVGAAEVLSSALRALGRVDQVFWASALSATAALTLGLAALYLFEVAGAVVWLLVAWTASVTAMWRYLRRQVHKEAPDP